MQVLCSVYIFAVILPHIVGMKGNGFFKNIVK